MCGKRARQRLHDKLDNGADHEPRISDQAKYFELLGTVMLPVWWQATYLVKNSITREKSCNLRFKSKLWCSGTSRINVTYKYCHKSFFCRASCENWTKFEFLETTIFKIRGFDLRQQSISYTVPAFSWGWFYSKRVLEKLHFASRRQNFTKLRFSQNDDFWDTWFWFAGTEMYK